MESLNTTLRWQRVIEQSQRALARGALLPIETQGEELLASGIAFQLRVAANLGRKVAAAKGRGGDPSPFLPPDPELFVANLSATHLCLLNKFNVLANHVLIVTRSFQAQETALDRADFAAVHRCLEAVDGLAFYNAGRAAGASEHHKHLQLVPPLGPSGRRAPLEAVIGTAQSRGEGVAVIPSLPFAHALVAMSWPVESPAESLETSYRTLRDALGLAKSPSPYNLLLTRNWMMLIPRRREAARGISINALGFAGSFFARSQRELDVVRRVGPLALLARVARRRQIGS